MTLGMKASLLLLALGIAAAAPAPDDGYFAAKLYPILEAAQCRLCHNDNGIASRTRLQFPPEKARTEEITAFGLRLRTLVDRNDPEQSLLFRKPTNRLPHTGGERIRQGGEAEKVLRAWIGRLVALSDDSAAIHTKHNAAESAT